MRNDQYAVTVNVDGEPLGIFDTQGGGEADSEESLYHPGGMQGAVSLGGRQTVSAITVGRLYDLGRDHDLVRRLMNKRGKARASVSRQPLDVDGNPYGAPFVFSGTLKTVTLPDVDSESNDAAVWTMTITTESSIA